MRLRCSLSDFVASLFVGFLVGFIAGISTRLSDNESTNGVAFTGLGIGVTVGFCLLLCCARNCPLWVPVENNERSLNPPAVDPQEHQQQAIENGLNAALGVVEKLQVELAQVTSTQIEGVATMPVIDYPPEGKENISPPQTILSLSC